MVSKGPSRIFYSGRECIESMKQKKGNVQEWFVDAESEYRQIRLRVGRHVLAAKTGFQAVELINTDTPEVIHPAEVREEIPLLSVKKSVL